MPTPHTPSKFLLQTLAIIAVIALSMPSDVFAITSNSGTAQAKSATKSTSNTSENKPTRYNGGYGSGAPRQGSYGSGAPTPTSAPRPSQGSYSKPSGSDTSRPSSNPGRAGDPTNNDNGSIKGSSGSGSSGGGDGSRPRDDGSDGSRGNSQQPSYFSRAAAAVSNAVSQAQRIVNAGVGAMKAIVDNAKKVAQPGNDFGTFPSSPTGPVIKTPVQPQQTNQSPKTDVKLPDQISEQIEKQKAANGGLTDAELSKYKEIDRQETDLRRAKAEFKKELDDRARGVYTGAAMAKYKIQPQQGTIRASQYAVIAREVFSDEPDDLVDDIVGDLAKENSEIWKTEYEGPAMAKYKIQPQQGTDKNTQRAEKIASSDSKVYEDINRRDAVLYIPPSSPYSNGLEGIKIRADKVWMTEEEKKDNAKKIMSDIPNTPINSLPPKLTSPLHPINAHKIDEFEQNEIMDTETTIPDTATVLDNEINRLRNDEDLVKAKIDAFNKASEKDKPRLADELRLQQKNLEDAKQLEKVLEALTPEYEEKSPLNLKNEKPATNIIDYRNNPYSGDNAIQKIRESLEGYTETEENAIKIEKPSSIPKESLTPEKPGIIDRTLNFINRFF